MHKTFCSICGKDLKKCKCKEKIKIETKVTEPEEIKNKKDKKEGK